MAVSWANLTVGPVFTKIINTLFDYLQDQFRWQAGMKDELERLREYHPKIQAVVSAANQADIIDKDLALNKWIWQLRDAIDEADDLLDDFEYMRHAEQLVSNTEEETSMLPFKSFISPALENLRKFGERAFHYDPNLEKLQKVVQKLDKVSAEFNTFLHLVERAQLVQHEQLVELNKNRETGSLPTDDLLGRGDDKEFIMQWLNREPSNEEHQTSGSGTNMYKNISLLSIVGDGGMGKTTLLQHVYKDEMTNQFDLKMWVCVSNNFDFKKVIAGMLNSLNQEARDSDTLETLQCKLQSEVTSKKFLLVLDDIWGENDVNETDNWKKVFSSLSNGRLGSKILITTRMDSAASKIANVIKKKKEVMRLEGLEEDQCLKLLTTHAFAGVNQDDHKKLKYIAEELVKKLYGSPLAAKVIGGVMRSKLDEKHWRKVLNSKLGQNDIFPILKLSYIFLPKHLQNCFSFCSIFPQDYKFDKDDLVRMWIAVGFIQSSNNQEDTLEDIGEKYFEVLVKKSFFDKDTGYYKMHDLLHELAQFVSNQECFRDAGDKELLLKVPETIRHLSIELCNLKVLRNERFKNLRTLRITNDYYSNDVSDSFNEIFKASRSIRLLEIQYKQSHPISNVILETIEYLKQSHPISNVILEPIEYLKHLRFLRYGFSITQLPRSLTKLYHLQFIICDSDFSFDCYKDDFFPSDMNNLSNLRYMSYPCLNFFGIGKLKFLQKLEKFYVKKEIGYRIEELQHMNDLCILGIEKLENMSDATDASKAKLCDKKKLTNLSLNWAKSIYEEQNIVNHDFDERVLDNLQPPKELKELNIYMYMGVRSAVWMKEAHFIENLEEIVLSDCLEWKLLPPFGQLRFLKILRLRNMPKVKRVDSDRYCDFPSLEQLEISCLEALKDWFDERVDNLFPRLTKLQLYNCPDLQELPYLPPKLETLKIDKIGWKTLNCCSISKSIPLKELIVRGCPNITVIYMFCEIGTLAMLKNLKITNCPNSISFFGQHNELIIDSLIISNWITLLDLLRSVTSVRELIVEEENNLISFSVEEEQCFMQVSSSIRRLNFRSLRSLKSLPSILTSFSSLEILDLCLLPQLQKLPELPASLELLHMYKLESLQCLPYSLSTISSLNHLELNEITLLKSLPDLPPSLCTLYLCDLDNLECLPDLPPSLCTLDLCHLDNLKCLPSCLSSLTSLKSLSIIGVPLLRGLPKFPPSLDMLRIANCHPNLEKRYDLFYTVKKDKREQI